MISSLLQFFAGFFKRPENPWIFGDEYIYISKARNLKFGIDVIADASLGHSYPPLYSYLISLVVTGDPTSTYRNIQLLNIGISQLLLIISFYILNLTSGLWRSKRGRLLLGLGYLVTATLPIMSGFYFVAMSENLFIPLVVLIFSLVSYLGKIGLRSRKSWLLLLLTSVLISLSALTRSIGWVLVPSLVAAMTPLWLKKSVLSGQPKLFDLKNSLSKRITRGLLATCLIFIGSVLPFLLFSQIELLFVKNFEQSLSNSGYSSLLNAYLKAINEILSGHVNWFVAFKIWGNHLIYLFLASFFFPFAFFFNDLIQAFRQKKFEVDFLFLFFMLLGTSFSSFLHCYQGFESNPIKYSTYFRYLDPAVVTLVVYGLVRLGRLFKQKTKNKLSAVVAFGLISLGLIWQLPKRDFYGTINSLGWAWLDLFKESAKNLPLMFKLLPLILVVSVVFATLARRRVFYWLVGGIILINLLTIRVNLAM
ncbi:MAG: hypothetical protein GF381_00885, partial [Candidatus Pacebacteria bacterium]|nr:hypothetical protein [Candidatus Paceibacterota bacterium]